MLPYLYSMIMRCAMPYLRFVLKRRLKRGKEHPKRYPERMGQFTKKRPQGALIWLHGASVGESLSILPIVSRILTEYPNTHILVTTGTVTSAKLMEERLPKQAFHQFIPMDSPLWCQNFLDHWQPDAVIWLESDFWPNLLMEMKRRDIPAVLVNARMSERSFRRWKLGGAGFLRHILTGFHFCLAQNEAEQKRLQYFGHQNVFVTSNLKYASDPLPVNKNAKTKLQKIIGARPVWQFASTHPGEERLAAQIHQNLSGKIKGLLTVIIPRHLDRGEDVYKEIANMGLKAVRRSENQDMTPDVDIYIADTIGEMGLFFDTIDLVVMGGSFVPHGGHNPIEPAQFGCAVMYGPHMFNFKTICHDFETAKAAYALPGSDALEQKLKSALEAPARVQSIQTAAKRLTQKKAKAGDELWSYLGPWIAQSIKKSIDQPRGQEGDKVGSNKVS